MKRLLLLVSLIALPLHAQPRIASDFDIERMEKQLAASHDFVSQLSARLNLGDLRLLRNETSLAHDEYARALDIATKERLAARRDSNLARYANATSYAALASAKLGDAARAFELASEALRYASDDARTWNLCATAMSSAGLPKKATSAARNAVALASRNLQSVSDRLDLGVYQYALASALIESGHRAEAESLLTTIIASLDSHEFAALRRDVASRESFEIYSTARGDAAAYLSLRNRAQLRLASLLEERGALDMARSRYLSVLHDRNDDATALAALARLTPKNRETYANAFDANPFSLALIRDFRAAHVDDVPEGDSTGALMRRALIAMNRSDHLTARRALNTLEGAFPFNDVVAWLASINDVALGDLDRARSRTIRNPSLRQEVDDTIRAASAANAFTSLSPQPNASELRTVMMLFASNRITPEQRTAIDRAVVTGIATFDEAKAGAEGQTVFESGTIDGVPFRFSEPTAFTGAFAAQTPLRLTYRILGTTEANGADALLLEPVHLEVPR